MTLRSFAGRLAEAGLYVTAAFLPLSIVGAQLGGFVMGIGALLAFAAGARGLLPRGLGAPVVAFIALCLLATLSSPVAIPWEGWVAWRPALYLVLVPAALAAVAEPSVALRRVLIVLLAAALFGGVIGIIQHWTGFDLNYALGLRRAPIRVAAPVGQGWAGIGTLNSRLTFSAIESAVFVFAAALAIAGRGRWVRIGGAVVALGSGLAVATTFARAAWIGAFAGLAVLGAGMRRRAAMALVAIALAAGVLGAAVPSVRARAISAVKTTANSDRLFIWARAGEVLADHPVQGVGVYGYPRVAGPYYDRHDPGFPMRTWAHDMFFTVLVETGVGGLIAYVWLFVTTAALALAGLRGRQPDGWAAVRLGSLGAMVSLLGHSLFHDILYDGEAAMALFFFAGLAVSVLPEREAPLPQNSEANGTATVAALPQP